jgi:aminoglycoside phosphotransferase (APT) family kinase protein
VLISHWEPEKVSKIGAMPSQSHFSTIGTPVAEHDIDTGLIYRLLLDQHPDLANLPLDLVDAGWDNVMCRLGDRLAVRLPRRQLAAALIEHEQAWLPQLAKQLTLPIPTALRAGYPTLDYPWRWSVVPWFTGVAADQAPLHPDQAQVYGDFLRSLHVSAPANAPRNPYRGVPLQERATFVEERMQRLATKTDLMTPALKQIWQQALAAPIDVPPTWLHGDLHPRNLLVDQGAISAVIDWGDLTAGDRATDLASLWMLFGEPTVRQQAIAVYGDISAATRHRAKGWAIFFGVVLLDTGLVDNPRNAATGEKILRWVVTDND